MNKERLLELAGLSSNLSNPSQEPYTEIPSASEEPPAHATVDDDAPDYEEEGHEDGIKELAMQGLHIEDVEEARDIFQRILNKMGEEIE